MPKILIVDDEPDIVELIQFKLKVEGYETLTAFDGPSGLAAARAQKPDLIVLDVMMPGMDGFEVLKFLKRDEATADIPVVMLTARAQDQDVTRGWESGVDFYLTKPFDPAELAVVVKRILQERK